jgi:TatD DNase family protein
MHIFDYLNYDFLFDSHAHLTYSGFDDALPVIVKKAEDAGVKAIFDIGTTIETSIKAISNAKEYEGKIFAYVGIDPEVFEPGSEYFLGFDKNDKWFEEQYGILKELITNNPKLIAGIGETGMDYYHVNAKSQDPNTKEIVQKFRNEDINASKSLQEKLFRMHIRLGEEFNLQLSIHSRGAERECLDIVKNTKSIGIFHSYAGDYEVAKEVLDIGWGLGVNGIVTFKNAKERREVFKKILGKVSSDWAPRDFYKKGIFFETDAPFLAPEGKRGQTNEPANIRDIYELFIEGLAQ